MEISQITYCRVFNLGNYETETIQVQALVHFSESAEKVYTELKEWTMEQFLATHPASKRNGLSADSPQSLRKPT